MYLKKLIKILEDLKDGDAFADKYNSELLNHQLLTKDGVKTGFPKKAYNAISKEKKSAKGKSLIFRIPILNLI